MRKRETAEIGAFKYEVTQLNATDGADGILKVQKIMAAANGDMDQALGAMSQEDLRYFTKLFTNSTRLISTKHNDETGEDKLVAVPLSSVFDNHFAGEMLFDMLQWLAFCMALNFGFFFKRLTADGALIKVIVEKALSNAPQTGQSGES